jgi:uncharacterized delta-60 repeat protein
MVVQPDGRILVGGGLGFFYAMARFMPDGSLDPGFGQDGIVQQAEPRLTANGIALLPDGRIVLAGGGLGYTLKLSRYESNGLHDGTFGTNGVVDTGLAVSGPFSMARQADGRFVFVFFYAGGFTLVRLDSDGSIDAGFGSGGIVNLDFFANAVVVRPDGKIFVGGSSRTLPPPPPPPPASTIEDAKVTPSSKQSFEVRRFNPDGTPDESFGKKGLVTTSFYDPSTIQALALDAQGRLVAAGNTVSPSGLGGDFALARYQPDGSPDRSFGKGGRTIADVDGLGLEDSARAIAVQPDGRLVVVGFVAQQQADLNNSLAWGLARFLP